MQRNIVGSGSPKSEPLLARFLGLGQAGRSRPAGDRLPGWSANPVPAPSARGHLGRLSLLGDSEGTQGAEDEQPARGLRQPHGSTVDKMNLAVLELIVVGLVVIFLVGLVAYRVSQRGK